MRTLVPLPLLVCGSCGVASHARLTTLGTGALLNAVGRRRLVRSHLQAVSVCNGLPAALAPLERMHLEALHVAHVEIAQLVEVGNGRSYGRGLL